MELTCAVEDTLDQFGNLWLTESLANHDEIPGYLILEFSGALHVEGDRDMKIDRPSNRAISG